MRKTFGFAFFALSLTAGTAQAQVSSSKMGNQE